MKYKTINSDKSNTPYSDAIEIGDIIEFSGMIGNTENGLVEGGFESELNQIFKNLKDIPNLSKFYNNNYFIWFGKKANYKLNRVCFSKFLENKF